MHPQAPIVSLTVDLFASAKPVTGARTPVNVVLVVGTDVPAATLAPLQAALEREVRRLSATDRVAMIDSGPEGEIRQGRGSELASNDAVERLVARARALRPCPSAVHGAMFEMGLGLAAKTSDGAPRTRVIWCTSRGPTPAEVDVERLQRALDAAKKYGFDVVVVPLEAAEPSPGLDAVVRRSGGRRSPTLPSLVDPTPPRVLLEPRVTLEAGPGVTFVGAPGRTLVLEYTDLFAGAWSTNAVPVSVDAAAGRRALATVTFEARRADGSSVAHHQTLSIDVAT